MVEHYFSPDEEMALVDHLKGMSLASGAARELKSLLACLVMIGKEDIARKLQRVGENFQLSQKAAVKLAEDAMACDIVDEDVFVLELYIKKLRNELLQLAFAQSFCLLPFKHRCGYQVLAVVTKY